MGRRDGRHTLDDISPSPLDMSSIIGDQEEQTRLQLENNLQDLSIQFSITSSPHSNERHIPHYAHHQHASFSQHADHEEPQNSDVSLEYPRHDPNPREMSAFVDHEPSFLDASRLNGGYDSHPYSVRHSDDSRFVNYFSGDTISTAAHHASRVTLSAGLAPNKQYGRGRLEDIGSEYDPDRPLDDVLRGLSVNDSIFDVKSSRRTPKATHSSRYGASMSHATDKNRTWEQGGNRSLPHDISKHLSPRLGDALSWVNGGGAFSPKRPRSVLPSPSARDGDLSMRSKTRHRRPELKVQPPTPMEVSVADASAELRRDLSVEHRISTSARQGYEATSTNSPSKTRQSKSKGIARKPFQNIANHPGFSPASRKKSNAGPADDGTEYAEKLHLPDITGLTSAVGSPSRIAPHRWGYADEDPNGIEGRVISTITNLQTRLNQLESHNLVSRRRVRELELELESCKAEVKRERTRVLEREEIIVAQQREVQHAKSKVRGANATEGDRKEIEQRYKQVLAEKQALESLTGSLRSHLARLTAELSSHQDSLAELRAQRHDDRRTMDLKLREVDKLVAEVDRLGNEVQTLRLIVEEGLEERRKTRETADDSIIPLEPSTAPPNQREGDSHLPDAYSPESSRHLQSPREPERSLVAEDDNTPADFSDEEESAAVDGDPASPFIEREDLQRVNTELEERRSDRSQSERASVASTSSPRGTRVTEGAWSANVINHGGPSNERRTQMNRVHGSQSAPLPHTDRFTNANLTEPSVLAPNGANRTAHQETPFPQIRGEFLERLFFSAPEHNIRTCAICHRRRRPRTSGTDILWPDVTFATKPRNAQNIPVPESEDEGFQDGEEDHPNALGTNQHATKLDKLPRQTVVVRVIRELEDDFTHYKGIYVELADQYKVMDAVSNVPKRNVLAQHLKEVVDVLERKGDQIASLYSVLKFKDKPVDSK